jgi:hypothetical protein
MPTSRPQSLQPEADQQSSSNLQPKTRAAGTIISRPTQPSCRTQSYHSHKPKKGSQKSTSFPKGLISNLAGRCQPFTHLMKKDKSFYWDEACTNAFNKIKQYLLNHLSFKHRYRDAHLSSILWLKYVP